MAEKKAEAVWMADGYGAKAYVPAAEVDNWRPRGWSPADEPAPGDLVWMGHDGHGGRASFPTAAVAGWQALGWSLSPPPDPVDLTKDPALVDQPSDPPEPPKKTIASKADKEK